MSFSFPRRGRTLSPGQQSLLEVIDLYGDRRVIVTADEVIEAPNWSPDGQWLVFNAGGQLFRISPDGGAPEHVATPGLDDLNNDHVLSPDGSTIYVSSDNGHLYAVPFAGGAARKVSNDHAGGRWPMSQWSSLRASEWSISSPFRPLVGQTRA
jgi:sugar lactone lactonase YvrE